MVNRMFKVVMAGVLALTMLNLTGCSKSDDTVVIAGKTYTEALFTSEIIAQLLEAKTDLKVERKFNLASAVCFEAVRTGEADIFPEYTGGGLMNYLDAEPAGGIQETYDAVKAGYEAEFGLTWLEMFGFNNTYANAISREFAEEHNIYTNSALAPFTPELRYGANHGFYDRGDGYDGMCELYGFNFKEDVKMDVTLIYEAIKNDEMDVANVYTTDGQLQEFDLVVLEDDKGFFPPYYCAPVVRMDTLEKHPEIADALKVLKDCATEEDMIEYNYKIDKQILTLENAATEFINEKGLLD